MQSVDGWEWETVSEGVIRASAACRRAAGLRCAAAVYLSMNVDMSECHRLRLARE